MRWTRITGCGADSGGKFVDPGMRIGRGYKFLAGELTKAGTATKRPKGKSGPI